MSAGRVDYGKPVRAEPSDLVESFFVRGFLEPVLGLLERVREHGVLGQARSAPSAADLGLLGAVVADAYGIFGVRAEEQESLSNGEQLLAP